MTVITNDIKQLSPVAFIARTIISLGQSGRLPITSWFQEVMGIGSGTVQKALQELKKSGAVALVSRGHQGTFVVSWNFSQLWDAARMPPVHILLPPRGSQEATQIASAFAQQCSQWDVAATVSYLRGAYSRLAALQNDAADIVLLSSGSAQMLLADPLTPNYEMFDVGNGSYYRPESLVVVEKTGVAGSRRPRVGIDSHSSDHQRLTRAQFPEQDCDYVEVDFTLLPRLVFLGEVDTGVWHQETSLIPLDKVGLEIRPLDKPQALEMANAISSAVLVVRAASPIAQLLRQLDFAMLRRQAMLPLDTSNPHFNGVPVALRFR
ncbi:YhfZ family protein [Budvicia diplopodorum]|uniref:YhfZ family protein n=1 Tax=Budvicia diplopodorum TaxID=1119056 RepID=UPI00135B4560|nr:YhfZ family protein [Budvicia diplopodorum]